MQYKANPINQIRGMRNNAQGHIFEDALKQACEYYKQTGRADIDKTPEPFRVMKKSQNGIFTGRFIDRAQPDYQGTLAGGRSIIFEAKYTTTDRIERRALTDKQMETLESHYKMGAVALVVFGIQDKFYVLPWRIWDNMKPIYGRQYLQQMQIASYRVKFNGAVLFLDYLSGNNWIEDHYGWIDQLKERCGWK